MSIDQAYNSLLTDYIYTLIWQSTTDDDETIDQYSINDISDTDKEYIVADIKKFDAMIQSGILESMENIIDLTGNDYGRIMHDFVLTRNNHGAGFWDGDYNVSINDINIGDLLTEYCKSFSNTDLYIGDDGKLYLI
jgi:hypothetical protein